MLKKLEAVILDFDGTIVDTEYTYFEVMSELVEKYSGKKLNKLEYIKNVSGTSVENCKRYIMKNYDLDEKDFSSLEIDLINMYEKFIKTPLLPNIKETFQLLKDNNIKIAIASNGTLKHIVDGLREHKIINYVDEIVTKYDVENAKPKPDIYLEVAKRLEVDIKNCIAVEDSVTGAKAAECSGAYLILQTNEITKHLDFTQVNYKIKNCNLYDEIKNILNN